MALPRDGADDAGRPSSPRDRVVAAWRALDLPQRGAGALAGLLLASLLLPWYSVRTSTAGGGTLVSTPQSSLSAFGVFSYVEAAVLLVGAGVVALVLARGDGRGFLLPARDGTLVAAGGGWCALLVAVRLFDRPTGPRSESVVTLVGLSWGVFVSLGLAIGLAVVGVRMRAGQPPGPLRARLPGRGPAPAPTPRGTAPPVRPDPPTAATAAAPHPRTPGGVPRATIPIARADSAVPVGDPWWRRRGGRTDRPDGPRRPAGPDDATRVAGEDPGAGDRG